MTAICGGGTSAPKTGTSAVVLIGSGVIATMLGKSGNAWLEFAAALLTLPELVLSSFCASDPPAMPTFTSAEAKALLNLTFGADLASALPKFANLVQNLAWQEYCACTSGSLVVPGPVTPPSGTPIYQPPQPQIATPCAQQSGSVAIGPTDTFSCGPTYFHPAGKVATAAVVTCTSSTFFGTGTSWTVNVLWSDGAVLHTITSGVVYPTGSSHVVTIPIEAPSQVSVIVQVAGVTGGGTGQTTVSASADIYCNGALPGLTPQACCPPDVATQSTLDLILKTVTLLQRQIAPFGYIAGASHAGLSGNGVLTVAGIIGIKVDLTTLPGRLGDTLGDPVTLWDAGWINLGTADGFGPRQFIASDPFLVFPVSGAVTQVGYSIPADVACTITELVREA